MEGLKLIALLGAILGALMLPLILLKVIARRLISSSIGPNPQLALFVVLSVLVATPAPFPVVGGGIFVPHAYFLPVLLASPLEAIRLYKHFAVSLISIAVVTGGLSAFWFLRYRARQLKQQ